MDKQMKSKTPISVTAWLVAGGLSLGLAGYLLAGAGPAGEVDGVAPSAANVGTEMPGLVALSAPSTPSVAIQATAFLDPNELLPAFWGDRWPEVEAALFPDGLANTAVRPICAWDDAVEALVEGMAPDTKYSVDKMYRQKMRWPTWEFTRNPVYPPTELMKSITPESVAAAVREPRVAMVDQATVDRWDAELLDINVQLDGAVREYLRTAGDAVRMQFANNTVQRAPLDFPDKLSDDERYFDSVMGANYKVMGWSTRVLLSSAEYPDLAQLDATIERLRAERLSYVRGQLGF